MQIGQRTAGWLCFSPRDSSVRSSAWLAGPICNGDYDQNGTEGEVMGAHSVLNLVEQRREHIRVDGPGGWAMNGISAPALATIRALDVRALPIVELLQPLDLLVALTASRAVGLRCFGGHSSHRLLLGGLGLLESVEPSQNIPVQTGLQFLAGDRQSGLCGNPFNLGAPTLGNWPLSLNPLVYGGCGNTNGSRQAGLASCYLAGPGDGCRISFHSQSIRQCLIFASGIA